MSEPKDGMGPKSFEPWFCQICGAPQPRSNQACQKCGSLLLSNRAPGVTPGVPAEPGGHALDATAFYRPPAPEPSAVQAGNQPRQSGQPQGAQAAFSPGTQIREYRVQSLLGSGGMGGVYLARHRLTDQLVAIKVINPELTRDEGIRRRFVEEARVLSAMSHPNITRLLAFFEHDSQLCLVMEYVHGESLKARLSRESLSVEDVYSILKDVLSALQYSHSHTTQVVHRDIKPDNILLEVSGRAVITDFGVAKAAGRERLTQTQGVVGTWEYMSPEQVLGNPVSPASDLYSTGIMLYKMLTGSVPYPQRTDSGVDCMNGHLTGKPRPLGEFRGGLPAGLQPLLDRLLAKRPEDRPSSADEVLQELTRAMEQVWPGSTSRGRAKKNLQEPATTPEAPPKPPEPVSDRWTLGNVERAAAVESSPKANSRVPAGNSKRNTGRVLWPAAALVLIGATAFALYSSGLLGGLGGESSALPQVEPAAAVEQPPATLPAQAGPEHPAAAPVADVRPTEAVPPPEGVAGAAGAGTETKGGPSKTERPGMILVPGGPFKMGCHAARDARCSEDEKPYHRVFLAPYLLDKNEVTVSAYGQCVQAKACKVPPSQPLCNWGVAGREQHPMNCLTWQDASSYCRWKGMELPSEAQWEKAARGPTAQLFPWSSGGLNCDVAIWGAGDDMDGCGKGSTWPVCSAVKGNSPWGHCDLGGNVSEWVLDLYGPYGAKCDDSRDPIGPESGSGRVYRGGSWQDGSLVQFRASNRRWGDVTHSAPSIGFRCALSVPSDEASP